MRPPLAITHLSSSFRLNAAIRLMRSKPCFPGNFPASIPFQFSMYRSPRFRKKTGMPERRERVFRPPFFNLILFTCRKSPPRYLRIPTPAGSGL